MRADILPLTQFGTSRIALTTGRGPGTVAFFRLKIWRDMYRYSRGSGLLFLVLCWVLLLPPPCLWPEEPAEGLMETPTENSGSDLMRLLEISTRLEELNGRLQTELENSRMNSKELSEARTAY